RGNGSPLWSTPPPLHALANGSLVSQPEYTARCGPETPAMAASLSTTTSTPPPLVSKPPAPQKESQTSRTLRSVPNLLFDFSCYLELIVFQQAAQPLSTSHLVPFSKDCRCR